MFLKYLYLFLLRLTIFSCSWAYGKFNIGSVYSNFNLAAVRKISALASLQQIRKELNMFLSFV